MNQISIINFPLPMHRTPPSDSIMISGNPPRANYTTISQISYPLEAAESEIEMEAQTQTYEVRSEGFILPLPNSTRSPPAIR